MMDLFVSGFGLILLSPLFILISIWIKSTSKGSIFFIQKRVGKHRKLFKVYKFRSMEENAEQKGALTLGNDDKRLTSVGKYLRMYKLDELPQLFNIMIGNMSLVGPRPELLRYVALYSTEQLNVLNVKPGITCWASIKYRHEDELLGRLKNPEKVYIEEILPDKLNLDLNYIKNKSMFTDLKICYRTLVSIFS